MNVARGLERRLERLFEGVTGRVFSGRLHSSEIAGRLAREADLARFDHPTGPATGNRYTLSLNPSDIDTDPTALETALATEIESYAAEEGLRLEGPVKVIIETADNVISGTIKCMVDVEPGPTTPWAKLVSSKEGHDIGHNRALIGRAPGCDVVMPFDDVSREHSVLWRQSGKVYLSDLGSSNGTTVDGSPVTGEPTTVEPGSVVGIASHRYRLVEL